MQQSRRRNRLLPWFIGMAITVAAETYVAHQLFATACPGSTALALIALIAIPVVYLGLMFLTLVSQQ